jgi:hypothetical protein
MATGAPSQTWQRKWLFNGLMLVCTWIIIELAAFVALRLNYGSLAQIHELMQSTARQDPFRPGGHRFIAPAVIHPYLGAVLQPKTDLKSVMYDDRYWVTEFGFIDNDRPLHKRSRDRVIVGILGGSVARQFSMNATDLLAEELSKAPQFTGRKFQFVRLASDGYKQPQQLMVINYMLSMGAEFDILINLDGVNEAALPAIDNVPHGVFSAFPRDWGKLVAGSSSPEFARMAGYVSFLRKQQHDDAVWFSSPQLRYLPTAMLIWELRKGRSDQKINQQIEAMNSFAETEQTYGGSGPPEHFDSDEAMYQHFMNLWAESSILLQQLSAPRGIRYFHFLQPNQYVLGSKPIGEDEAVIAIDETSLMRKGVQACFPRMRAQSSRLIEAGVRFTDLTQVFADHPESLYSDSCCHLIPAGNQILARAIAARIRQDESHSDAAHRP